MSSTGPRVRCDEQHVLDLVRQGLTNDQVCAALGITTRTFTRWRVARPELSRAIIRERRAIEAAKPEPEHGTMLRYKRGCKCEVCRAGNNERLRVNAARAQAGPIPDTVAHGRVSTYRYWGCRCAPCREANTIANRPAHARYRARVRAGQPVTPGRRGRPRNARPAPAPQAEPVEVRIEQAIACGRPTSWIMEALSVTYAQVQAIRDAMAQAAAS